MELPLPQIAMLKYPASLEIVLAHRSCQGVYRGWDQIIAFLHFAEREMESFLVPINMLIIKIGVFVEPKA